jgi:phosphate transport system regulatory protein PhoU
MSQEHISAVRRRSRRPAHRVLADGRPGRAAGQARHGGPDRTRRHRAARKGDRQRQARSTAHEVELDEACNHVIAKRQPAAVDLRMIMTVVKTITDLERIGDEAKKIAKMARAHPWRRHARFVPRVDLRACRPTLRSAMLRKALDAFARLDLNLSAEVVRQDREVDAGFKAAMRQLITFMMEDPRTISSSLDLLFIAKLDRAHRRPRQEHLGVRGLPGQGPRRAAHRAGSDGEGSRALTQRFLPGVSATASAARSRPPGRRHRRRNASAPARPGTSGAAHRPGSGGSR